MSPKSERGARLRVDVVIVPPCKPGIAFAHAADGRCLSFTGEREAMLRLCAEHRAHNLGQGPPVFVNPADWKDVAPLDDCADCWIHQFVPSEPSAA